MKCLRMSDLLQAQIVHCQSKIVPCILAPVLHSFLCLAFFPRFCILAPVLHSCSGLAFLLRSCILAPVLYSFLCLAFFMFSCFLVCSLISLITHVLLLCLPSGSSGYRLGLGCTVTALRLAALASSLRLCLFAAGASGGSSPSESRGPSRLRRHSIRESRRMQPRTCSTRPGLSGIPNASAASATSRARQPEASDSFPGPRCQRRMIVTTRTMIVTTSPRATRSRSPLPLAPPGGSPKNSSTVSAAWRVIITARNCHKVMQSHHGP